MAGPLPSVDGLPGWAVPARSDHSDRGLLGVACTSCGRAGWKAGRPLRRQRRPARRSRQRKSARAVRRRGQRSPLAGHSPAGPPASGSDPTGYRVLQQLKAGVDVAYADLTAATDRRRRPPVVDLVRRPPLFASRPVGSPESGSDLRRPPIAESSRCGRSLPGLGRTARHLRLRAGRPTSTNRHPRRPLRHRARLHGRLRAMATPNRSTPRQPLPDQHLTQRQHAAHPPPLPCLIERPMLSDV